MEEVGVPSSVRAKRQRRTARGEEEGQRSRRRDQKDKLSEDEGGLAQVGASVSFENEEKIDGSYFSSYEGIQDQKTMLEDFTRVEAYHTAILGNEANFAGKVVLDVGCGTGILAMFAAKAGAKKVYAVEATKMAVLAKALVAANGMENTVEVIHGLMEKVELPEKVDIIVSEFMGHFLLRESMLDCVLFAREKYLKPEGAIYPSSTRMFLAPITSNAHAEGLTKLESAMEDWNVCKEACRSSFDINLSSASTFYEKYLEHKHLRTSKEVIATPEVLLAEAVCIKEIDLLTATLDDVKQVHHNFTLDIANAGRDRPLDSFLGWFDFRFDGSAYNPSLVEVLCSTGPSINDRTHWGQDAFLVDQPELLENGDKIEGNITVTRAKHDWRMYDVTIEHTCCHIDAASGKEVRRGATSRIKHQLE